MRDYRSLEKKIRGLVTGRMTPDGWELVSENVWYHPVAEITRTIDADGNEQLVNKAGEIVERTATPEEKAKYHKKAKIQSRIIDEKTEPDSDKNSKEDKTDKKKDKAPAGKDKDKDDNKSTSKQSDDDPKKIKGGKTEVDIDPKTNDNLNDEGKKQVKEDALDEMSADKLKDYVNKTGVHRDPKYPKLALKKIADKKKDVKELFSPEELAHFDAVMAEEYVDMSKKTIDTLVNAKGKPHKVYTATDETRHGMGVDELRRHLGVGDSDGTNKKFMHNLHTAGIRTGWSHSAGKWIVYHGKKI